MGTDDGARVPLGPEQDTTPETHAAPESGERHSSKEGSVPVPP